MLGFKEKCINYGWHSDSKSGLVLQIYGQEIESAIRNLDLIMVLIEFNPVKNIYRIRSPKLRKFQKFAIRKSKNPQSEILIRIFLGRILSIRNCKKNLADFQP